MKQKPMETFKKIINKEVLPVYYASSTGNIFRLYARGKLRLLKSLHRNKLDRHLVVTLICRNGKKKHFGVRYLVAYAFLKHKPEIKYRAIFKDGNPCNCKIRNIILQPIGELSLYDCLKDDEFMLYQAYLDYCERKKINIVKENERLIKIFVTQCPANAEKRKDFIKKLFYIGERK